MCSVACRSTRSKGAHVPSLLSERCPQVMCAVCVSATECLSSWGSWGSSDCVTPAIPRNGEEGRGKHFPMHLSIRFSVEGNNVFILLQEYWHLNTQLSSLRDTSTSQAHHKPHGRGRAYFINSDVVRLPLYFPHLRTTLFRLGCKKTRQVLVPTAPRGAVIDWRWDLNKDGRPRMFFLVRRCNIVFRMNRKRQRLRGWR